MLKQVRGTKDIIGDEYKKTKFINDTTYKIATHYYGFTPIETPILEYTEVFTRTLGQDSDIINKEMYTFFDKSDNSITLRPEFTSAIARAFITNNLTQEPLPLKLISQGPVFRYERPQKGRQRQFNQINCEILGSPEYIADIEIISLAINILCALKIRDKVQLELNSIGDEESYTNYRQALICYLTKYKEQLSQDSQHRLLSNPLRILDSKCESDQNILKNAPKISDYYNEYSELFFSQLKKGLDDLSIEYVINPHLVRGLDYYCHTTFEFTTDKLGAQSTLLAGGRYNKLIAQMGGKDTPSVGFAGGVERISALVDPLHHITSKIISIIPIGEDAIKKSIVLSHGLRNNNIAINLRTKGNLSKRLKQSHESSAVIIIGEYELKNNLLTLKNMKEGTQKYVSYSSILESIQRLLNTL